MPEWNKKSFHSVHLLEWMEWKLLCRKHARNENFRQKECKEWKLSSKSMHRMKTFVKKHARNENFYNKFYYVWAFFKSLPYWESYDSSSIIASWINELFFCCWLVLTLCTAFSSNWDCSWRIKWKMHYSICTHFGSYAVDIL